MKLNHRRNKARRDSHLPVAQREVLMVLRDLGLPDEKAKPFAIELHTQMRKTDIVIGDKAHNFACRMAIGWLRVQEGVSEWKEGVVISRVQKQYSLALGDNIESERVDFGGLSLADFLGHSRQTANAR